MLADMYMCKTITPLQIQHISLNRRCPRIVVAVSKRSTRTHVRIVFDNGHHASASVVCVGSKTESAYY